MSKVPPEIISVSDGAWAPVRVAAAVNIALATPPGTIDGVLLGPYADRVALTAQTTPAQNGVYVLTMGGTVFDSGVFFPAGSATISGLVAGALYYASVTGTVVITGANGRTVTETTPGFLPALGDGTLTVVGGASGGTSEVRVISTLVRAADANADAEFAQGKLVDVREGTNAAIWGVSFSGSTPIASASAITVRKLRALPGSIDQFSVLDNNPAVPVVLGYLVYLSLSNGALLGFSQGVAQAML